jgi:polyribonucleotide 5'-hydroxyl-kinase
VGQEYTFQGQKGAVFTWHGCRLEYNGEVSEYVSEETPMNTYLNLHFALEDLRKAEKSPVVMVVGPANSGKSSLCKILAAYANKMDRYPMVVNLDPSEGLFTVPGSLSAAPVSDILDVEEGWGHSPVSGPSVMHPKQPLVYYYGLEKPSTNMGYYKHSCSRLALGVRARIDKDAIVRHSGVIVDTPGTLVEKEKDANYSMVANAVAEFGVSVIVVVGHERLFADMQRKFKGRAGLSVVKIPKSGGVIDKSPEYIRAQQARSIQQYFYGTRRQPLAPHGVTVDFSEFTVYRVAEQQELSNTSTLPIDEQSVESASRPEDDFFVKLEPSSILQNCVMAVLNASRDENVRTLVSSEVVGFVHV